MGKQISYADLIKNKVLKDFEECEENRKKKTEELACPSCGEIEQDPLYESICGLCGFKK